MAGEKPNSLDQKKTDVVVTTTEIQTKQIDQVSAKNIKLDGVNPPEKKDIKASIVLDGDIKKFEEALKTQTLNSDDLLKLLQDTSSYNAPEGQDFISIKNGYSEAILNYVLNTPALLPNYLAALTPTTLSYLGTDKATEVKLYNMLVKSDACRKLIPDGSDAQKNLLSVKFAIEKIDQISFREGMKQNFDQIIKDYGSILLSAFELFGGKGSLKGFCDTFHIDYDKNFASIEKLYDDVYQLDGDQKAALDNIYNDKSTYNFEGTDQVAKDLKCNRKNVEDYYHTWAESNFNLLDPSLVSNAMKQAKIDIPNLIVPNGTLHGEPINKINLDVLQNIDPKQKTEVINQIMKDPALWASIKSLHTESVSTTVYGKDASSQGRWAMKSPLDAKSVVVAVGAYLMKGSKDIKYIVSQNVLPYEQANRENLAKEKDNEEIKVDWNDFFRKCDKGGKREKFPPVDENKLTKSQRAEYALYTTVVSQHFASLFAKNSKDYAVINNTEYLKKQFNELFPKQFTLYLKSLKGTKKLSTSEESSIDEVLTSVTAIPDSKLKINMEGDKITITGSDANQNAVVIGSGKLDGIKGLGSKYNLFQPMTPSQVQGQIPGLIPGITMPSNSFDNSDSKGVPA